MFWHLLDVVVRLNSNGKGKVIKWSQLLAIGGGAMPLECPEILRSFKYG